MPWLPAGAGAGVEEGLPAAERLRIAAEVGSDLPLFLVGGTVLGVGRGEQVYPLPDLPAMACVVVTPEVGVSTPKAFAEWDRLSGDRQGLKPDASEGLAAAPSTSSGQALKGRSSTVVSADDSGSRKHCRASPGRTAEGGRPHKNRDKIDGICCLR